MDVLQSLEVHSASSCCSQFSLFPLTFSTFAATERVQINWTAYIPTFAEGTSCDFMLQHCCWSRCCLSCSVWPAAMMALWEQLPGSTPCSCATAPGNPRPLERNYSQTYWQTCCSCWRSMTGLPLHRCRYLGRNTLKKKKWQQQFWPCACILDVRHESVLPQNCEF